MRGSLLDPESRSAHGDSLIERARDVMGDQWGKGVEARAGNGGLHRVSARDLAAEIQEEAADALLYGTQLPAVLELVSVLLVEADDLLEEIVESDQAVAEVREPLHRAIRLLGHDV